jgi:hypothetical protein
MHLKLSLVVISALVLGALGLAAAQNRKESAESKILALESKWNDAYKRGDVSTMELLLSPEFVITVEDGSTFSESGYIAYDTAFALRAEI